MDIKQELLKIAGDIGTDLDKREAFTADISKKLFGLKSKYGIARISQNYKGTGSKKDRRQIYVRMNSGDLIDVWLESNSYTLGGVTINRIRGEFPYGDRSPMQIAEAIGDALQKNFGGEPKKASSARTASEGTVIIECSGNKVMKRPLYDKIKKLADEKKLAEDWTVYVKVEWEGGKTEDEDYRNSRDSYEVTDFNVVDAWFYDWKSRRKFPIPRNLWREFDNSGIGDALDRGFDVYGRMQKTLDA